MEIRSIFGLPAHALIVHAVVVLLPLAAVALIVSAVVPRTRRIAAPLALCLALVATVAVFLAEQSGEVLEGQVKETSLVRAHTHAADEVLPWALGTVFVALGVTVAEPVRRTLGKPSPRVANAVIVGLSLIAGVGATVTVIDVGHSGAKATWDNTANLPVRER